MTKPLLFLPTKHTGPPASGAGPANGASSALPSVIILGKLPPPYMGPAIATSIILRSDLRRDFNLHHVDTRAHESLPAHARWKFAKIGRNFAIYARLAHTVRQARPAVVVVPISQSAIGFIKDSVFIWIAWCLSQPVIVQLRGSNLRNWLAGANPLVRWYVGMVVRRASAAIVLGENLRPLFHGMVPDDRIFVVPNGGNYTFPPRVASSDGTVRFLYLANLRRAKGIEDLVGAVALLKERGVTGFRVDVVGEWTDSRARAICMQAVEQKALPLAFRGPKYDQEKFACFSAADVFVFVPREPEGHPWVIVEAMAAGLPLIATDRGAIRESLIDGYNGILTESSAEAVAKAMERFIRDRQLIDSMGVASHRHYHEHFNEARMVERFGRVFRAVLNR